jgi:hypothetical protein
MMRNRLMSLEHLGISAATWAATLSLLNVAGATPGFVPETRAPALAPMYPVIQYGHATGGGDAVGSGVLYNGNLVQWTDPKGGGDAALFGRADVHVAVDRAGELYLFSKATA